MKPINYQKNTTTQWFKRLFFLTLVSGFVLLQHTAFAQKLAVEQKADMLIQTVKKYHYDARNIDYHFAKLIFNEVINQLDHQNAIFSEEDITLLKEKQFDINDDLLNKKASFVNALTKLYTQKLNMRDSVVSNLSLKDFTFDKKDSIVAHRDAIFLPQKDLEAYWIKRIQLKTLRNYFVSVDSIALAPFPSKEKLKKHFDKALTTEKCYLQTKLQPIGGIASTIEDAYLNAVAKAFDPHTRYFNIDQERDFMNLVSKENASFGFEIGKNENGEMEVVGIIPGGPAWRSAAINEGDILLGVQTEQENKEFVCLSTSDVRHYIGNENLQKATFQIRKKNGSKQSVILEKEVIDIEENTIQSFLLEGKEKVGYIYLPSFYSGVTTSDKREKGCANDLAKELIKLKREGIKGLIIDLRNNGGGSMLEAVRMAGIFIDFGTVCIVESAFDEPYTLKDMNRGTIYNDPLIILVNNFSASASELLAASMQNYNRALIVGTPTYGKSTAQVVLPIDSYKDNVKKSAKLSENGYVKVTISAFYRVDKSSHQKRGVMPDINLPFLYDSLNLGERNYPSAMEPRTSDKKAYYKAWEELPVEALNERSLSRQKQDSTYQKIKEFGAELASMRTYVIPIDFMGYKSYLLEDDEVLIADHTHNVFSVKNPSYLQGVSSALDNDKEVNQDVMDNIASDRYILESYQIMYDLIQIK